MRKSLMIKSFILSLILVLSIALPVLASISLPKQLDVPIDKEWKIIFNQSVDSSTLRDNISLNLSDGTPFSIQSSVDPNNSKVVLVKHSLPFAYGTTYKLSVNSNLQDLSGRKLTDSISLSFDTISNPIASNVNYVALGDSIACDLYASPSKSYVDLFYTYLKNQPENLKSGMELKNLAVSGYTSNALLASLEDSNVKKELKNAKVITLCIGSNNLMKPTISELAKALGLNPQDPNFTTDLYSKLSDPTSFAILLDLMSPEKLPKSLTEGVTQFTSDWSKIISKIRTQAPNAQIYVMTLYNPVNQNNTMNKLIFKVYDPYIQGINNIIKKSNNNYNVADVYPLFLNNQGDPVTGIDLLNPHPTDKGHSLIYQAHLKALTTP